MPLVFKIDLKQYIVRKCWLIIEIILVCFLKMINIFVCLYLFFESRYFKTVVAFVPLYDGPLYDNCFIWRFYLLTFREFLKSVHCPSMYHLNVLGEGYSFLFSYFCLLFNSFFGLWALFLVLTNTQTNELKGSWLKMNQIMQKKQTLTLTRTLTKTKINVTIDSWLKLAHKIPKTDLNPY